MLTPIIHYNFSVACVLEVNEEMLKFKNITKRLDLVINNQKPNPNEYLVWVKEKRL